MTLVVASLVDRSIAGIARSSAKAFGAGADVVEVRFDLLDGVGSELSLVDEAREAVRGPAIATYRSASEGGMAEGREERRRVLDRIVEGGFEYVDLELAGDRRRLKLLRGRDGPSTIASKHFSGPRSRSDIRRSIASACAAGDIGKVAMPCEDASQALMLAEVGMDLKGGPRPFTLIGMGAQGRLTRTRPEQIGSDMVYCCLPGRPAAPGQLDLRSQKVAMEGDAVVLGLLGHPVSHSVSQPMQEAALRRAGLNGAYLPLDIPPRSFGRRTLDTLAALGLKGVNVTIPHKRSALRLCDEVVDSTSAVGAVNTLLFDGGKIVGKNTDLLGFKRLLEVEKVSVKDRTALVIGAGGAAMAACAVLKDSGARTTVSARRAEAAREIARRFGCGTVAFSTLRSTKKAYDVVVNCTPVGTGGTPLERSTVPVNLFRRGTVFVDLVYNPPVTRSMEAAAERGCKAHGGLEMLVHQGAEAFRTWTGEDADIATMRRAARRALE